MSETKLCEIGRIECHSRNGISRVSAVVDDQPVWFESADARLRPSAEALLSAFLIPALQHRRAIRIDAPLSALWRENAGKMLETLRQWWDYPDTLRIECRGDALVCDRMPRGGQCFSGGIDSFYSLLRGQHPSEYLVSVHGFDISVRDTYRMRKFRESLAAVSEAVGKPAIVLRTNLRKHGLFSSVPWERTHGGALAAVGHLLSDVIGNLVIPSSLDYGDPHPCGSHWLTDPLWSSENMRIIHDDATFYRLDKLKRIDSEPLVRRHLRVCWENRTSSGNCSRCDKCVRTMIVLAVRGQLRHYPVFDQRKPLPAILDAMGPVDKDLHRRYESLLEEGLPPDISSAMQRLLRRDRAWRFSSFRRGFRKIGLALARVRG